MDDAREPLELEARRCTAISAGDLDTLRSLLTDDYVHVHMNALVDDRAGHLKGVAKRPRTTTRGEILVRVYGDLAVLTGELTNQISVPAEPPRVARGYCSQVAVRQHGTWRFASFQLTPLQAS